MVKAERKTQLGQLVVPVSEIVRAETLGRDVLGLVSASHIIPNSNRLNPPAQNLLAEGTPFQPGDILYGRTSPQSNRVWLADAIGVAKPESVLVLRPQGEAQPEFLAYMMRSAPFVAAMSLLRPFRSAVPINFEEVESIEFPGLDRSSQELWVRIFRVLDDLLEDCKASLLDHEALAAGVFRELFGSSDRWSTRWRQVTLGDLLEAIEVGVDLKGLPHPPGDTDWGIVGSPAASSGFFSTEDCRALHKADSPPTNFALRLGDLLVTPSSSKNIVGRAALLDVEPGRLVFSNRLWRLRPKAGVSPAFLKGLLDERSTRAWLQRTARQSGGSATLGKANFGMTPAFVPPEGLQARFEKWYWGQLAAIREQRLVQDDLENLQGAISLYLFRGLSQQVEILPSEDIRPEHGPGPRVVWNDLSRLQRNVWQATLESPSRITISELCSRIVHAGFRSPSEIQILHAMEVLEMLGVVMKRRGTLLDEWRLAIPVEAEGAGV